jgi:hypothetical protein
MTEAILTEEYCYLLAVATFAPILVPDCRCRRLTHAQHEKYSRAG